MTLQQIIVNFSVLSGDDIELIQEQMFVEDGSIFYISDNEFRFDCNTLDFYENGEIQK